MDFNIKNIFNKIKTALKPKSEHEKLVDKLQNNPSLFFKMDRKDQMNLEFITVVMQNKVVLNELYVTPENIKLMGRISRVCPQVVEHLPKEMNMALLKTNSELYLHMSDIHKKSINICRHAIYHDTAMAKFIPKKFFDNDLFVARVCENQPSLVKHASSAVLENNITLLLKGISGGYITNASQIPNKLRLDEVVMNKLQNSNNMHTSEYVEKVVVMSDYENSVKPNKKQRFGM